MSDLYCTFKRQISGHVVDLTVTVELGFGYKPIKYGSGLYEVVNEQFLTVRGPGCVMFICTCGSVSVTVWV